MESVRAGDELLFSSDSNASYVQRLEEQLWQRLIQPPVTGRSERVSQRGRNAVCVPHQGGFGALGDSVRRAGDLAGQLRATVLEHHGVLLRRVSGVESVCVVVEDTGQGRTILPRQVVWRSYHRGSYETLPEREAVEREEARRAGHRITADWTLTLFHDPSQKASSELWSTVDSVLAL